MSMIQAYEEVVDFIAAEVSPQHLIDFHPSDATKMRVADLIAIEKTAGLSVEEASELDRYLQLEHVMRLAKARVQQTLSYE